MGKLHRLDFRRKVLTFSRTKTQNITTHFRTQTSKSLKSVLPIYQTAGGVDKPLKQPFHVDQDVDILNATAVGKVEALRQVGLQVRLDFLVRLLTLKRTETVISSRRRSCGVERGEV